VRIPGASGSTRFLSSTMPINVNECFMKIPLHLRHLVPALSLIAAAMLQAGQAVPDAPNKVAPLPVGTTAPNKVLLSADGPFDLGSALKSKPTILVFYRGNWCSLGKDELVEFQREIPFLLALGYQVIAVSPDRPESLKPTTERFKLGYPLVSDHDLSLSSAYGIAFLAPKDLENDFARKGITLATFSGQHGAAGLLVPSVFIVDTNGIVRWVYSNPKKNPSTSELITAASKARRAIASQANIGISFASQP
jgi:peroxiredoxin